MSDRDRPFDPFGRSDRTVIRPNPGGRRPAQAAAAAPLPPYPSPSPAAPSPAAPAPSMEEWVSAAPRIAPSAGPPASAPKPVLVREEHLNAPNENPVMKAAGPLLLALGQFRANMVRSPSAEFMEQVAQAIAEFERRLRDAGVPSDQVNVAKYLVCATADDIVQNMPVEDRHIWTQYSMLSRFFGERVGGVRFFDELERAKADPALNYPVLELFHACLALGFEGKYRTMAGGAATLQHIQRNLYETLRRIKAQATDELSPRWQGQMLAAHAGRRRIPLWAVASVLGVLLFGFFFTLRALLGAETDIVEAELARLTPAGDIAIVRPEPVPPPPPPEPPRQSRELTQIERIRLALANEIKAGKVDAQQTANEIIVAIGNVGMFETGSADVLDSFKPIAGRIAETLEKEPGPISIIGHTDNVPIKPARRARFASNYELSLERAKTAAELFRPRLSDPSRLKVDGKGADAPIAPNTTPEGRAKNRRVEIMIPRAD